MAEGNGKDREMKKVH